jgi:hypothetical protein
MLLYGAPPALPLVVTLLLFLLFRGDDRVGDHEPLQLQIRPPRLHLLPGRHRLTAVGFAVEHRQPQGPATVVLLHVVYVVADGVELPVRDGHAVDAHERVALRGRPAGRSVGRSVGR